MPNRTTAPAAAHTPGPWMAEPCNPTTTGIYCNDATGSIVAQVGGFAYAPRPDAERAANARLIAAAPDLLAACKAVLALIDVHGIGDEESESEPVVAALRAAIAAAERGK